MSEKIKLRRVEFEQLDSYVQWQEESGIYYGCKRHFDKRHKRIKAFIEQEIKEQA